MLADCVATLSDVYATRISSKNAANTIKKAIVSLLGITADLARSVTKGERLFGCVAYVHGSDEVERKKQVLEITPTPFLVNEFVQHTKNKAPPDISSKSPSQPLLERQSIGIRINMIIFPKPLSRQFQTMDIPMWYWRVSSNYEATQAKVFRETHDVQCHHQETSSWIWVCEEG